MSNDDIVDRFRVALFTRVQEVGVSEACRESNVHRSASQTPTGVFSASRPTTAPSSGSTSSPRPPNASISNTFASTPAGPQSKGCVGRVPRPIVEECVRPTFARAPVPRLTASECDLRAFPRYYNHERVDTGGFARG